MMVAHWDSLMVDSTGFLTVVRWVAQMDVLKVAHLELSKADSSTAC